jgi:arginine repressor
VKADLRSRRQKAIADMIRTSPIGSQEEVTSRLIALGFPITQATVSRDLDQLGAVKVKRGGVHSYALPDQMGASDWAAARLKHIVSEWVQSVEAAGNLIVIRTPPGQPGYRPVRPSGNRRHGLGRRHFVRRGSGRSDGRRHRRPFPEAKRPLIASRGRPRPARLP